MSQAILLLHQPARIAPGAGAPADDVPKREYVEAGGLMSYGSKVPD